MIKKIFKQLLMWLGRSLIIAYKPVVIGITGSVGKTTVKEAACAVLKRQFNVRGSFASYNTESGLPLTIIGVKSPRDSKIGWLIAFIKGFYLLLIKNKHYPHFLVLEMGADSPGDISRLLSCVRPDIGILTAITPAHLKNFKSIHNIQQEKIKLVRAVHPQGTVILNADDELAIAARDGVRAEHILTYGFTEADVRVVEPHITYSLEEPYWPLGMQFKIAYKETLVPMEIYGVLGRSVMRSVAAGVAVGLAAGMHLIEAGSALEHFMPPPGRMRIFEGIKNTCIIDDTYNASPRAVLAALEAFSEVRTSAPAERWVVLGDMRELGDQTEQLHRSAGFDVARMGFDHLVTVGQFAKIIGHAAAEAGMDGERIYAFSDADEAKKFLQNAIKPKDALLIKGSRAMHLEEIVRELIADPLRDERFLVHS